MTYTLVVGAAPLPGHEPFYRELLAVSAHVVAADAAGEWCVALGRVPDAVVGDFDGAQEGAQGRLRALGSVVDVHPAEKDATDLELAVAYARSGWDVPVVLTAAFTSRVDHTLAAFGALTRAGDDASVREPGWTAFVCRTSHPVRLDLALGTTVSVLPLSTESRFSVDGAVWLLDDAVVPMMSGLGISNRASGGAFTVEATNGIVVVMVQGGA